jgi:WD40 repeat protein/class 3 adenylate cyclase
MEKVEMSEEPKTRLQFTDLPEGTVTFLFTDIEGSTQLLDQLRDQYAELLSDQRRILRDVFANWHGQEVDTQGDAFFVAFPRATEAVCAVVEIQRRLTAHDWPEGVNVCVRMGLHTGEPWLVEEGYIGMDVHRAARIAHVGHGGQVLLSETTTPLVHEELPDGVELLDLGTHRLKDMRRPEHIHQLVIEGLPNEFPPLNSLEVVSSPGFPEEAVARPPREVGTSPYQGLAAFREQDAHFFFGREDFTAQLVEALHQHGLVAVVVGSSGSGKSSTVFAGLLPQLRKDGHWLIISFRPGGHPLNALASALLPYLEPDLDETDRLRASQKLADGLIAGEVTLFHTITRVLQKRTESSRLLLVIDQFEELYTLCPDPQLRDTFLDELLTTVEAGANQRPNPSVMLLTLRADFMGQALTHRPFADALQAGSLMLGPMKRVELQAAVEKPAELQGAAFEPGLVERLLDDVGEQPGNLPLLEFALTLLWERMDQGWLTHEAYDEIGQVEGALARYADEVYQGLTAPDQAATRKAFVQLVQPGQGTEDTRRVAHRADLAGVDWGLVQHLADKRLVVTGLDQAGVETLEVVHEALIRGWGQLRVWMAADRAFRNWQEGLRVALKGWQNSGGDEGALLRGAPLAQAREWLNERGDEIGQAEKTYIQASIELQEKRWRARARRRRWIFGGLAAGLVIALILSMIAFTQQRIAQQNANRSESIALALEAEKAFESGQNELALTLALEAVRLSSENVEAQRILTDAAMAPGAQKVLQDHNGPITALAISPDGKLLLSAAEVAEDDFSEDDLAIRLWDLETGGVIRKLIGHQGVVRSLDFSPDGRTAVSGGDDYQVFWWEISSGEPLAIHDLPAQDGYINHVQFHPDGDSILVQDNEWDLSENTRVMDIESGEIITEMERGGRRSISGVIQSAWISTDGLGFSLIYSPYFETRHSYLITYDFYTGQEIDFLGTTNFTEHAAVSAFQSLDVESLLIGSVYGPVALIDLGSGNTIRQLFSISTGQETKAVALSPDGKRALAGFFSGELCQWNLEYEDDFYCIFGHEDAITAVAFLPDSAHAVTGSADSTIRVWDLQYGNELLRFDPENVVSFWGMDISSDGRTAISGTGASGLDSYTTFQSDRSDYVPPVEFNDIVWWDANFGQEIFRDHGHKHSVWGLAISEENDLLISTARWEGLRVLDLVSGDERYRYRTGQTNAVTAITPDPYGKTLFFATADQRVNRLDLDTFSVSRILEFGNQFDPSRVSKDYATALAISPDGSGLLVGTNFGHLFLFDLDTGTVIKEYFGHSFSVDEVFFLPGGERILSLSRDLTARIWDLETGNEIQRFVLGASTDEVSIVGDISPDGSMALLSSTLWDLDTFEQLTTFNHQGLNDVAFCPDGKYIYTSSADGTVRKWEIPPRSLDQLLEWIEANRYVPMLSQEEQRALSQ